MSYIKSTQFIIAKLSTQFGDRLHMPTSHMYPNFYLLNYELRSGLTGAELDLEIRAGSYSLITGGAAYKYQSIVSSICQPDDHRRKEYRPRVACGQLIKTCKSMCTCVHMWSIQTCIEVRIGHVKQGVILCEIRSAFPMLRPGWWDERSIFGEWVSIFGMLTTNPLSFSSVFFCWLQIICEGCFWREHDNAVWGVERILREPWTFMRDMCSVHGNDV